MNLTNDFANLSTPEKPSLKQVKKYCVRWMDRHDGFVDHEELWQSMSKRFNISPKEAETLTREVSAKGMFSLPGDDPILN